MDLALLYAVLALVGLTTLLAGGVLLPRLHPPRVRLSRQPEYPKAFGAEMSWIAVPTTGTVEVLSALGLEDAVEVSWDCGLGLVYDPDFADRYVFVTPALGEWTLVAGVGLPMPSDPRFVDKLGPLLATLADRFGEAQYFAAFAGIDYFAWARLRPGEPLRAFAAGESGILWNTGRLSAEERALGLGDMRIRGIADRNGDIGAALLLHPSPEHVFRVAAQWSYNPMAPQQGASGCATGWIAPVPRGWRSERVRRAA